MINNSDFTIGQKIRWLSLFIRTPMDNRFHNLVAAIFGVLNKSDPVVLDIGANVGHFVKACLAQNNKPSRIIAVEPSAIVFPILNFWTKTIWRKKTEITTHKVAFGNRDDHVTLKTPIKESGSLRVGLASIGNFDKIKVFSEDVIMTTIDNFLTTKGVTKVDLVKMDVEGAENMVLSGADELFYNIRPVWYLELDNSRAAMFGENIKTIFDKFVGNGYFAYVFVDEQKIQKVTTLNDKKDYLFIPK